MIRDFFLFHGNMTDINRYESFPFENCVDKKVIFWNEPNCDDKAYETLS